MLSDDEHIEMDEKIDFAINPFSEGERHLHILVLHKCFDIYDEFAHLTH